MRASSGIKAIIFDMGGVLLRTEDQSPRQRLSEQYGLTQEELMELVFDSEAANRSTVGELEEEEIWQYVRDYLDIGKDELEVFRRTFWEGDRMDFQLLDFLRSLRPEYRLGLLSNAWSGARAALAEKFKFGDVFDILIFSSEVGLAKPDAAIYRRALEQLGVEPHEAVFVDDYRPNVEAARQSGLHAIQFKSRAQVIAELEDLLGVDERHRSKDERE